VFLANDADMACFAEHWFAFDQNVKNIIYMYSGVSCGLLLNGELYRGARGCVGELFVNRQPDSMTALGDVGFLHGWHHDLGLVSRANALLVSRGEVACVKTVDDVFALHVDGITPILDDAAHALGVKIAFLVNTLNPDAVVIGGGFERGGRMFIDAVDSYVRHYAFGEMTRSLQIMPTGLGESGVALGAAAMMAKNVFACV
jgi:predicted NBD/HSP70 family sugar kinase